MKKIGIIGGAGPAASALLYSKIITSYQQDFNCWQDSDFPEIIIVSYPFTQMLSHNDAQTHTHKITRELQYCFDTLNTCGVDTAVVACNTLHTFLPGIHTGKLMLLDLPKAVCSYAQQTGLKKLLVLGTEQTIKTGLYTDKNLDFVHTNTQDQKRVSQIIDTILRGKQNAQDTQTLSTIITMNIQDTPNIDGVILGCTELSVLVEQYQLTIPPTVTVLDPLDIVTRELVRS